MNSLAQRLQQMIYTYWRVPEPEAKLLLSLLVKSPCTRVTMLRQHLTLAETSYVTVQGLREADLSHTFAKILTPQFMFELVRDLHAMGSVSATQTAQIEEALLRCVSREGQWKAV